MKAPVYHRIEQFDRSLIPNRLIADLDAQASSHEEWRHLLGQSPGHPAWGLIYHLLLCRLERDQPNIVLETGTNFGTSTIMMAQAIRDSGRLGRCYTIELEEKTFEIADKRFKESGLSDLIQNYCGDSISVLSEIIKDFDEIQFAFLDGSHFHDHVLKEFEIIYPKLSFNSIVVFDNTYEIADAGEDPRVHGALKTLQSRFGGNLVNLPYVSWYTPGIAIWQKQPFKDMNPP